MTDFSLSKREQEIWEKAQLFTRKYVTPFARQLEETEEFPWALTQKAFDAGLMNSHVPKKYGGPEHSMLEETLIGEAIGYGDGGVATTILANNLALTPILISATPEQLEKYIKPFATGKKPQLAAFSLTEREAGTDAAAVKTTAVKDGDEWVINGMKCFSTNGHVAKYHSVFTTTDPSQGYKAMTVHLVDRELDGVEITLIEDKMGQRASFQCEVVYNDVRVPDDCLFGEVGEGFKIAMKTLDRTRTAIAALAVGIAQRAVHEAAKFANHRKQFGKPIGKFQGISFLLADMEARAMAARWATRYAAWLADKGIRNSKESACAKFFATDAAMQNTTDCVQIMGGYGYLREYPAEQLMRGAKLTQIYEGTNQVQRLVAGNAILKEVMNIDTGFRLQYKGHDAPDPWETTEG
jgi:acyl-CoA dehydrogenase